MKILETVMANKTSCYLVQRLCGGIWETESTPRFNKREAAIAFNFAVKAEKEKTYGHRRPIRLIRETITVIDRYDR